MTDWDALQPNAELLQLIPEQVALKYTVFPYALERGKRQSKITLAVTNPSDVSAITDISFLTNCVVKMEIASARAIRDAIQRAYHGEGAAVAGAAGETAENAASRPDTFAPSGVERLDTLLADLARETPRAGEEPDDFANLDREQPADKMLLEILEAAVNQGASEIHVEPCGQEYRVRLRVSGSLTQYALLSEALGRGILARLRRNLSRPPAAVTVKKEQLPSQGSLTTKLIPGKRLTLSICFYQTSADEKALMKLNAPTPVLGFEKLGFNDETVKALNRLLAKPYGLLLFVSPARQGKTTTYHALLRKFGQAHKFVCSLESALETVVPEIQQISFQPAISSHEWVAFLSYNPPELLGLDPVDAAGLTPLALEFASSSLVVASLTAADRAHGLSRFLTSVAAESHNRTPQAISFTLDAINGVISQRLARIVCPACKAVRPLAAPELRFLQEAFPQVAEADLHDLTIAVEKGCPECDHSGYRGQIGIFDVMRLDLGLKQFLVQHHPCAAFQVREFWDTLAPDMIPQQALQLLREGTISLTEFQRVAAL